jgi:hypothetical protein
MLNSEFVGFRGGVTTKTVVGVGDVLSRGAELRWRLCKFLTIVH